MIRRFFISGYQMTSAVAVRAITALLLNKMVAVMVGPAGITLFSHLQNLMALANQLPHDGINKGFIQLYNNQPEGMRKNLLKQVLMLNMIITSASLIVIFLFYDYFWSKFADYISTLFITTFILSSIFIIWFHTFLSYFQARREFRRFAIISAVSSLLVLAGGAYSLEFFGFKAFMMAFLIGQSVGLLIAFIIFIKEKKSIFSFKIRLPDRFIAKHLFEFILMASSVLIFTYLADFIIRTYAIDKFGAGNTGYWQAVVRISDYYRAVFIAVVGAIFYAEVSANLTDKQYIKRYLIRITLIVMAILAFGFTTMYLARNLLITLLYDRSFLPAIQYLPYQLMGDFFALTAFLFVYILMAQKRTLAFITVQAASTTAYILLIFLLLPIFELSGIVMAHFYRNIFFLLLVVLMNRKVLL